MASVGPTAHALQDMATIKTTMTTAETTTREGDTNPQCRGNANPPCDPTHLCEVLGEMNNSLEHLEKGYFECFHETVKATREVLADLNEVDATYVDTVLEAMRKWQADITLAITGMHTDDCVVWDTKRNAIDEATQKFGQTCETSCITRAEAREARQKAVVEGDEKDPIVELLDKVLEKTRIAVNHAVEAFQKQFKEALVPCMPAAHLPVLVSNAYNTVSQFHMTIWQMVADECIMPMQHNYLTNFGLATVMQHALEKVPSTCMRIMPPRPLEPKDDLTAFLDSLGNASLSHALAAPIVAPMMALSNVPPLPGVLPTGGLGWGPAPATAAPVFGGAPLTLVPVSMVTGVSLFQTSTSLPPGFKPLSASVSLTSTSSTPAAVSTPKASGSGVTLPISIPLLGHPGGRPDFLTDPIQAGSLADMDEEGNAMIDEELRKMAGDISQKHTARSKCAHDDDINEDEEGKDGDGSMFEDLDEPAPTPTKKASKARSPTKSGPTCWLNAEIDVMHQNRYGKDRPEMRDYCLNYLSDTNQKTFNLKNHSKYLNIILLKPGITQDVVFTKEAGRKYFAEECKISTDLYDQGLLMPLPAVLVLNGFQTRRS